MLQADVIVVGGGSAGAALAGRLSVDEGRRVLLIEAGRDTPPGAVPADIRSSFPAAYFNRDYFWPGLSTRLRDGEPAVPYLQPRVIGGGSSVMGMIALRGLPGDYARWEAMGARGWGWDDVAPVFEAMTADAVERGPNAAGCNIVRRLPRERWPRYVQAIEQSLAGDGRGDLEDGFFAVPLSQDEERAGSARCYLTPAVRARANLTLLCETRALRLTFDGRRVTGVEAESGGECMRLSAPRVVVACGAIHSPALLLRSGIGPAEDLAALGIPVVAARGGVGRNFQNHVQLHFSMTLKAGTRLDQVAQHYVVAALRFSSGLPECPSGDLFHYYTGRVSPKPFGRRMAMLAAALYAPRSRGRVCLTSPDLDAPLAVEQRLLAESIDQRRMLLGARRAEKLLLDPRVRVCFDEIYLMPRQPPLKLINGTGLSGTLKSAGASALLAAPGPIRRAAIAAAIKPGRLVATGDTHHPISDRDILGASGAMFHPSGTCAMGREGDGMAVVDPECRVYGVEGLRVADASVMPCIVSANTNFPTVMIAERVAGFIRAEDRPAAGK